MSNLHFTSDLHINHANIIRYASRPYSSVEEMNEALIENWNKVVKPGDVVWNLGDFAFMELHDFKKVLKRLNGQINLCLGNHDKMISKNRKEIFELNKIVSIQNYAEINVDGRKFVLSHYAHMVWNRSHHGAIHCYGHSHGTLPPIGLSVDVGVDCKEITAEYRPVSLEEVLAYMKNREINIVDYHPLNGERK